jgi:hypothetical protein
MSKFLILTANLGNKDILVDPPEKFDNCDYIAIVDKKYNTNIWEQFSYFDFSNFEPTSTAIQYCNGCFLFLK